MSDGAAKPRCVVVGAGHAAAQLCGSLVQAGWSGDLSVVGDEPHAPYHRPPLSKSQLDPNEPQPLQLIKPVEFYQDKNIRLLTGQRVVEIDRAVHQVALDDGQPLTYDTLVLATGSTHHRPPIPGADHPRVFTLQTAAHAEAVRSHIPDAKSVAIIGAGFIGLEAAASLRKLGIAVTVLEFADRVLSRVTSPEVSEYFAALHRGHGVDLHTGAAAAEIEERGDGLCVKTIDGRELPADFVLVGVGASPNTELAQSAGLPINNGILVNAFNQTQDPAIYAVGDCCNQHHPLYDTRLRLESVQNASDQAKTAAAAIMGQPKPHTALPWFCLNALYKAYDLL